MNVPLAGLLVADLSQNVTGPTFTQILGALRECDRTGRGANVTTALYDTALAWSVFYAPVSHDVVAGRQGRRHPVGPATRGRPVQGGSA